MQCAPWREWRWDADYYYCDGGNSMIEWLFKNWGWLLASVVCAGYFAFYVLAIREQQISANTGKPWLPCDRC